MILPFRIYNRDTISNISFHITVHYNINDFFPRNKKYSENLQINVKSSHHLLSNISYYQRVSFHLHVNRVFYFT